jgi:hypothetical protein
MEVDRHFVKNGAFGRGVNQIVGVLLCDTQIIMVKKLPRDFLPLCTRPVNDISQVRFNPTLTAASTFEPVRKNRPD